MNDVLNEISKESLGLDSGFSGDLAYTEKKDSKPFTVLPRYKVWNPSPAAPTVTPTPGIIMTSTKVMGEVREKVIEGTIQEARVVVLYTLAARKLGTGNGSNYRVLCQSHDGSKPSLRIDQPLCRKTSATDVANIISQWKGMDQAKIDAKVQELTEGTGQLRVCGIKAANGTIAVCPYARKDPITGNKAPCKSERYVRFYDIERKREFDMVLTGKSDMSSGKFIAPFHEFFKYLRTAGNRDSTGKPSGHPCYAYSVLLSVAKEGNFYYLNVTDWKPIEQAENRSQMTEKAFAAKEDYEKQSHRLSKETYERQKAEGAKGANSNTQAASIPIATSTPSQLLGATPSASKAETRKQLTVEIANIFEDGDDINF